MAQHRYDYMMEPTQTWAVWDSRDGQPAASKDNVLVGLAEAEARQLSIALNRENVRSSNVASSERLAHSSSKPASMDKDVRASAFKLRYVQRLAMKKIGWGSRRKADLYGIGLKTLEKLVHAELVERHFHESTSEPTYRLTVTGRKVFQALDELGWFPPG